jgi:hypothetical protein
MALPVLKPRNGETIIPLMHDTITMDAYEEAIPLMIKEYIRTEGRAPHILIWGDVSPALAVICLEFGARHVTIADTRPGVNQAVSSIFKTQYSQFAPNVTMICKNPLQLEGSLRFDALVMHAFGPTVEAQGMFGVAWDLINRNILEKYENDTCYVVPCEAAQTVAIYHIPAAIVESRVSRKNNLTIGSVDGPPNNTPIPKVKWQSLSKCLPGLILAEGNADLISNRVTISQSTYDNNTDPLKAMSHVRITPNRTDVPVDECFLVVEWMAILYPEYHDRSHICIGNLLGLDRKANPLARRARYISWNHHIAPLNLHATSLHPVNFALSLRVGQGDVALTVCEGLPTHITNKTLTPAQLAKTTETTFLRLAKESHEKTSRKRAKIDE